MHEDAGDLPASRPAGSSRYGFGEALADAWGFFGEHLTLCSTIFGAVHVAAALLSLLLLVAASSLGSVTAIPARLTAGVVLPVMAGSLGVAILSRKVRRSQAEGRDEEAPGGLLAGLDRADIVGLTLVAALLAVAAVIFLGGYGVLILPFFYGPPIAMQIVVERGASIPDALRDARGMLVGAWNTMLYLFAVALILGVVSIVPVGGLVSLAGHREDLPTIAVLSLGRGLLIGLFSGFLGAMQITIYRRLRERSTSITDGAAIPD